MANNTLLASDNFASGSLAAGWSAWPNLAESAITAGSPFYAEPTAINTSCGQLWTALTWGNDQISEVTIQSLNTTGTNVLTLGVRYTSGNSGYQAAITHASGVATLIVQKITAGSATQLGSTVSGLTIASGDVWSLSALGAVIAVYQNGTRIFYIGDATFPSGGAPGFFQSATNAVVNSQVASWRGYNSVQQDGIWTKQGVIFAPTAAEVASGGNFGTGVTGMQGVIYDTNPQILAGPSVYKGWFTNLNGVNYAESADGISWTRYSSNPVISAYANGQVFKYNGIYYHWGQPAASIGSATAYMSTSADGIHWSAQTATNLPTGGTYPNVYYLVIADVIAGIFYALFSALNGTGSAPNTYLATSADGITWAMQNSGNPVLANVFGMDCSVLKIGSTYYMYGTANQPGQGNPSAPNFDPLETVLYSSTDLINWTLVHHSIHRSGLWESLNSTESGAYATSVLYMPTLNRVGMYYVGSPGDSTGPQVYQGGLALAPVGSTLAAIVSTNEDGTTQVAVDAFTSGVGPLSANWTTQATAGALKIVAGPFVEATTTAGSRCVGLYTGASFGVNQYSEITVHAMVGGRTAQFILPLVLGQVATHTYYYAQLTSPTGTITGGVDFQIGKSVNNVGTVLSNPNATPNNLTVQVGDVIRLASTQGSDGSIVLSVYQNGFLILQAQDYAASITSGFPGIQINNTIALTDAQISLWAGGNTGLVLSSSLIGLTQAQAIALLISEGFAVGTITGSGGLVISSNPAAGTLLAPGSTVNFVTGIPVPTSGAISGNVVKTGALVECVSDHFDSSKTQIFTTLSDSSGNYSFSNLPVGRYYIGAWASGFVYRLQVLVVVDGVNANTDINLTPSAVNSWNGS